MTRLRAPLKTLIDDSLDEARVQRMWRGLSQASTRPQRSGWVVAGALALCVAVAVGFVRFSDAGALAAEGGGDVRLDVSRVALSDGSRIALGASAQLDLVDNSSRVFALRLQRGRAHFEVTPGGPRQWRIECGLAQVLVVGTQFTIDRGVDELRVEVDHGVVEVRGERVAAGVQRLIAGQTLEIRAEREGLAQLQPSAASAGDVAQSANREALAEANRGGLVAGASREKEAAGQRAARSSAPDAELAQPPLAAATEKRLARARAERRAAMGSSQADGRGAERRASVAAADVVDERGLSTGTAQQELLDEADRARRAGLQERALALLQQVERERPGTKEAAIAAFTRARMQLPESPGEAAEALRASLAAGAPDGLREDVLARLVEAYVRAGERELAAQAAADYRRQYPGGQRSAEVERWASGL